VKVLDVQEGPLDQQRAKLAKGDLRVVVVFPPDFGESVMQHRPAGIKILTDPSQQQSSRIVAGIVREVVSGMERRISGQEAMLNIKEEALMPEGGKNESRQIDF